MSISILEAINSKPSKAIQFALKGIENQQKRPDFRVDLLSYGRQSEGSDMCYGCVATCAIQELAGVDLTASTICVGKSRSKALGFYQHELEDFEIAIDRARLGELRVLLSFCGLMFEDVYILSSEFLTRMQLDPSRDLQRESLIQAVTILEAAYSFLVSKGL